MVHIGHGDLGRALSVKETALAKKHSWESRNTVECSRGFLSDCNHGWAEAAAQRLGQGVVCEGPQTEQGGDGRVSAGDDNREERAVPCAGCPSLETSMSIHFCAFLSVTYRVCDLRQSTKTKSYHL